jgi:hypothetical protein
MEKRQQKTAMILKYAKRRFDGGQEVDLIRAIERQNQTDQLGRMYGQPQDLHAVTSSVSVPLAPAAAVQLENQPAAGPKPSKVWEAVIMGPLQIAIGMVGMLTAGLAIVTFRRVQNEVMLQQGQLIFRDCAQTFRKGLWDTLTTPVRVVKAIRRAKA